MSQQRNSVHASFLAGDSISAYQIVTLSAGNTVNPWATATSVILGVAADSADSGAACDVIIMGSAKVQCGASISAGSIVVGQTDTALGVAAGTTIGTNAAYAFELGIALEAGSTNSVIEVLVRPSNRRQS